MSTVEVNRQIIVAFKNLEESDFKGYLVILDLGKIRIRWYSFHSH